MKHIKLKIDLLTSIYRYGYWCDRGIPVGIQDRIADPMWARYEIIASRLEELLGVSTEIE